MVKKFKTIKDHQITQDTISVFASGPSVLKIKEKNLQRIYEKSFCIWFNFAPSKYHKYIDCLFWMDWKVSKWVDKFYQDKENPIFWSRDMAFYNNRDLKLKDKINYWFDDESDYLENTNLSLVKCLLELKRHYPDKKILIFGLDLKGPKFYSKYIAPGSDNWKHPLDQQIDLDDCCRDLRQVEKKNIINCNLKSSYKRFKIDKWENHILYNNTLRLKGPSGLGDTIYSYPIVKHYIHKGFQVEVLTKYPDVFRNLDCRIRPYYYFNWDIDFSYVCRKFHKSTNQFEDMRILAGIKKKIPLEIKYNTVRVFNTIKKICVVQRPYFPMNDSEKRYELMPQYFKMQYLINKHREYYYVMIGPENKLNLSFDNIDEVITETDIDDLFQIINSSDMVLSQIGWTIAMAEALNKKIFVLFNANGLKSLNWFFRTITPKKVITKKTSYYAMDNLDQYQINERFEKLCSK